MPWKIAAIIMLVGGLFVAAFPAFGPPAFRYTGSDPGRPVWNFGWPLPHAIYDPQHGTHFFPMTLEFELSVWGVIVIVCNLVLRMLRAKR